MSFFGKKPDQSGKNVVQKGDQNKEKAQKRKKDDGWGEGWGSYMREKERKLQEQFQDMNKNGDPSSNNISRIFNGVCIFVNGYTNPSSDQLKQIMADHGGLFQHYYSKRTCTHIIATNLPDSKIKELKNEKVVHPNWILDSVQAGACLPCESYLLYKTTQMKQAEMFFKADRDPANTNKIVKTNPRLFERSDAEFQIDSKRRGIPVNVADTEKIACEDDDYDDESQGNSSEAGDFAFNTPESGNLNDINQGSATTEGDYSISNAPVLSKHDYSSNVHSKPISKAGDASFVNDFYSNSRLHHLSMWRSELKRFASMIASSGKAQKNKKSSQSEKCIMHIDMDSFFVSVTLKERPDLKGKPVAVCHASKGTNSSGVSSMSEIASCSYEARSRGVRNGMFLGQAKKLCPELICVPYKFESYRVVSQQFYEVLASFTSEIEAVSCDEALLDISDLVTEDASALDIASRIRESINATTCCKASAGIASNILLARMATRKAKPNGQFHLTRDDVRDFIGPQKVTDLPGVGYSLAQKLKEMSVTTCSELRQLSLAKLQENFGPKTGLTLHKHCRGLDDRTIKTDHERQSVSAEINYGIRFVEEQEAVSFIKELSKEVHERLSAIKTKGTHITLKIMVRKKEAPEPRKHMGHGICDNLSKSTSIPIATDDQNIIAKECVVLLKGLRITASDIRGMGIQVSKLVKDDSRSKGVRTIDFSNARPALASNRLEMTGGERLRGSLGDTVSSGSDQDTLSHHNIDTNASIEQGLKRLASSIDGFSHSDVIGQSSNRSTNCDTNIHSSSDHGINQSRSADNSRSHTFMVNDSFGQCASMAGGSYQSASNSHHTAQSNSAHHSSNLTLNKNALKGNKTKSVTKKSKTTKKTSPRKLDKKKNKQANLRIESFMKNTTIKDSTKKFRKDDVTDSEPPLPSLFSSPDRPKLPPRTVEFDLPSPSQIDPSVFNALPDDVRQGIWESYRAKNQNLTVGLDPVKNFGQNIEGALDGRSEVGPDLIRPNTSNVVTESDTGFRVEPNQPIAGRSGIRSGQAFEPTTRVDSARNADKTSLTDQLSLSQIDPEVMSELPEELRKEILQNIKFEERRKKREEQKKKLLVTGSPEKKTRRCQIIVDNPERSDEIQGVQTEISEQQPNIGENIEDDDQTHVKNSENNNSAINNIMRYPDLCGKSDFKDVKQLIRNWIQSSDDPYIEDIEAVTVYIEDLISFRNMEQAFLLLKYIQRLVKRSDVWSNIGNAIQCRIQEMMQNLYGGTFSIAKVQ